MYITQALDEGDGFAHLKRWRRGTYILIHNESVRIRVLGNPFIKPFNVSLKYLLEIEWLPGKGEELCDSCKEAESLEKFKGIYPLAHATNALINHLRSPDHCKCEGRL